MRMERREKKGQKGKANSSFFSDFPVERKASKKREKQKLGDQELDFLIGRGTKC